MESTRIFGAIAVVFALVLGACGSDDEEEEHGHQLPATCQAIVDACHHVDTGDPGDIHTCHESAHGGDEAYCNANQASCVALCEAAAMDAGHD